MQNQTPYSEIMDSLQQNYEQMQNLMHETDQANEDKEHIAHTT